MSKIILAGKEFHTVTNATFEHDTYVMRKLGRTGLEFEMKEGETPEQFAARLSFELMAHELLFDLIGGFIMPADKTGAEWTPEIAKETAKHCKALTDEDDKRAIRAQVVSMVTGFFVSGLVSILIFPKSSSPNEQTQQTQSLSPPSAAH